MNNNNNMKKNYIKKSDSCYDVNQKNFYTNLLSHLLIHSTFYIPKIYLKKLLLLLFCNECQMIRVRYVVCFSLKLHSH